MNSLTDLRDVVDVVIGVDTHSAAVLDTATGGVLDEITIEATAQGYADLVEFANHHATLPAWAIEGTSGHGAGLRWTALPSVGSPLHEKGQQHEHSALPEAESQPRGLPAPRRGCQDGC
jgi:hypothetical protein